MSDPNADLFTSLTVARGEKDSSRSYRYDEQLVFDDRGREKKKERKKERKGDEVMGDESAK